MTTGEYLFNFITSAIYTSAWWSLFMFPDDKVGEIFSGIRLTFLGITSLLIFWYVTEKLITEGREQK